MKKFALILVAITAIFAVSCNKETTTTDRPVASSQLAIDNGLNIRFVSLDSISKYYILATTTAEEIQNLFLQLQSEQNRLSNQLQSQANQIQEKMQSNRYLSEASYNADVRELNNKQNAYQNQLAQREMSVNQLADAKQKVLLDSINNFIAAFNAERKYDAILYTSASLYYNPALDITQDVIAGLNARYHAPAPAK